MLDERGNTLSESEETLELGLAVSLPVLVVLVFLGLVPSSSIRYIENLCQICFHGPVEMLLQTKIAGSRLVEFSLEKNLTFVQKYSFFHISDRTEKTKVM